MTLEAELRTRVDRSLKELEEVVGSLHHVKRLADTQQSASDRLSAVAAAMEIAGDRLKGMAETMGQTGPILQAAVDAVRSADPGAVLNRTDELGRSVSALQDRVQGVNQTVMTVGARVEGIVHGVEGVRTSIDPLRAAVDALPTKIDGAVRAQASALERLEKSLMPKIEHLDVAVASLEKRVGTAVTAAWVAAGLALIAAIGALVSFLR
jgi:uncharacterized protein YoxC